MTYTDHWRKRLRSARMFGVMALALTLSGCGELGSVQTAPNQFRIHGYGMYAREADLQRQAARSCPHGFDKTNEFEMEGTADVKGVLFLDIVCEGNSK